LGVVDQGVRLARRDQVPLDLIVARPSLPPMIYFVPISAVEMRIEIDAEAHKLLLEAISMVPVDVSVSGRLVAGRAWTEVQRIAKASPGELLAVRIEPRSRRQVAAVISTITGRARSSIRTIWS
jgi:hypothetical protein